MTSPDLHLAASKADAQRVVQLLAAGADPNARTANGTTPLMLAATLGHVEVVTDLLRAGADVNARDETGRTALFQAVEGKRSTAVVAILLKGGADPNIPTSGGRTALGESKSRPRKFSLGNWSFIWRSNIGEDDELVRLLVDNGAK